VAAPATPNPEDSAPSPVARPGNSNTIVLLAHDLNLLKPKEHEELSPRVAEIKRMLTGLIKKLKAES